MIRPTLCAGLLLLPFGVGGQTAEQRYDEWTRPAFPPDEYVDRRATLIGHLAAGEGGIALFPSGPGRSGGETFRPASDFLYLTGLELPDALLALDAASGSTILFIPSRDPRFDNPGRPNDFPGMALLGDPTLGTWSGVDDIRPAVALGAWLDTAVARGRLLRLDAGPGGIPDGLPEASAPWGPVEQFLIRLRTDHPEARVATAFPEVARTRMIKSSREITALRAAARVTMDAIIATAPHIRPGVDERTLAGVLEAAYKRGGAQRPAFASIIKSGRNSLWPWRVLASHSDRRNRVMRAGELVIFDVGAELDGYVSDIGRTFPVSGRFTDRQREILLMEVAVADTIIATARPGLTLADLQRAALAAIPPAHRPYMQAGFYFGHHLGLDPGDPGLPEASLTPGMVFTVEPWYYNHDLGLAVFTEDELLITPGGAELLTASLPRGPAALERLVRAGTGTGIR